MRRVLIALSFALIAPVASAQSFGDLLRGIVGPSESNTEEETSNSSFLSEISSEEADAGLREALILGAQAVGSQLSLENGYFGDQQIQIPLPGRLGELQSSLSRFGLSGPLDDLQLRLNRAAESAAPQAADLVVGAVQSLTIDDAISLLKGGDTAATDLLRQKTEPDLLALLQPYMRNALQETGAITTAEQVAGRYGLSAVSDDLTTQLIDHAVDEGLDGLFFYLAKEEQDIRNNPVKRSTDLLRRVFGG